MKKIFVSVIFPLSMLISVVSLAFAASAGSAAPIPTTRPSRSTVPVPFKGTIQAHELNEPLPDGFLVISENGRAKGTLIGRSTVQYQIAVSIPTLSGTGGVEIFTAANGDQIFAEGTGQGTILAPGVVKGVERYTITGGTGRFMRATGSYMVYKTINLVTNDIYGYFEGEIVLHRPTLIRETDRTENE